MENTGLNIPFFETGRTVPTLYSLTILCDFFGITLSEFFEPVYYPEQS